ncbi:MAG: DUF305 domain-containing protein [Gemmatimonadota bacterium]|jgi:uncharacterized protein (DUF305 family)
MERAARADSVREHYNQADVDFMTGMIHHHAQALVMARMAPSHGASESVRTLASRIINGQNDEIRLMQRWLRERGEAVPEPVTEGMGMAVHGGGRHAHMAGMLSPQQMERLGAARGAEWDRLFLTFMIQHHQGALTMVDDLFGTFGAGQGDAIFKIASDIGADQATEIDRMQRMLEDLVFGGDRPRPSRSSHPLPGSLR